MRFHRRHRDDDDDGDPDEDQYADASQYGDASQYDPRTGGEEDAQPRADEDEKQKDTKAERGSGREEKVDTEPASAGDDGGGWLGTVVGAFVVLWLLGAIFGR